MKLKYTLFIWCAVLRLNFAVHGTTCYECGGKGDKCPEFNPSSSLPTKTCSEEYKNVGMNGVCYKKIFSDGEPRTVHRSCGYAHWNDKDKCRYDSSLAVTECWCSGNKCNTATPSISHVPRTFVGLCIFSTVFIAYARN